MKDEMLAAMANTILWLLACHCGYHSEDFRHITSKILM
jgi:hypothetical protein